MCIEGVTAPRAKPVAKAASPPFHRVRKWVKSGDQRAKRFVISPLTKHLLCTSLAFLSLAARELRGDAFPTVCTAAVAAEVRSCGRNHA
jgi:hypothetical protein